VITGATPSVAPELIEGLPCPVLDHDRELLMG